MEKRKIKSFVDGIIEEHSEKVDAALVIIKDGENVSVSMCGIDEFMIGRNAVCIATAIRHLLETDLMTADKIANKHKKDGSTTINRGEPQMVEVNDNDTEDEAPEVPSDANEFAKMMGKALDKAIGEFLDTLKDGIEEPTNKD